MQTEPRCSATGNPTWVAARTRVYCREQLVAGYTYAEYKGEVVADRDPAERDPADRDSDPGRNLREYMLWRDVEDVFKELLGDGDMGYLRHPSRWREWEEERSMDE